MKNKVVAITGSTGGILTQVCLGLVKDNYDLILINRNLAKSEEQRNKLLEINPNVNIDILIADMIDIDSVKKVTNELLTRDFDYLILAAAIYNQKVVPTSTGYNNIFTVNFISPYYMAREVLEHKPNVKIITICSVAYKYAPINLDDIDKTSEKRNTHIYGNSKRFLMCSLMNYHNVIRAHPGVTETKLTSHYPKFINWLIVIGIKLLFPSNKKAARNILYGIDHQTNYLEWIGPSFIDLYGKPKIKKLKKLQQEEIDQIITISEEIYKKIKGEE